MHGRVLGLAAALLVMGVGIAPAIAQADTTAPSGDFTQLSKEAKAQGSVRVIIELKPETAGGVTSDPAANRAAAAKVAGDLGANVQVDKTLGMTPTMSATATSAGIDKLKADKRVARVSRDNENRSTLNVSTGVIEASTLWSKGTTGAGQTIAIVDTGVDTSHPMLSSKVTQEACFTYLACSNGQSSQTGAGSAAPVSPHGTHVASIAAGREWTSGGVTYRGVAPDARIIAIRVFQTSSSGGVLAYDSSILAALDWVAQQRSTTTIASVNLSLGGALYSSASNCDKANPAYLTIFTKLRDLGVAPVVAAGNQGATGSMSSPGCSSAAISVGALDNSATNQLTTYSNIASWTTLLAPGGGGSSGRPVYAAYAGGGIVGMSGTSMAAPHVAGAVALLRQVVPAASVATVVNALKSSGATVTSSRNTGGTRAIRVNAAALVLVTPTTTTTTTAATTTTTTTKPAPATKPGPAKAKATPATTRPLPATTRPVSSTTTRPK